MIKRIQNKLNNVPSFYKNLILPLIIIVLLITVKAQVINKKQPSTPINYADNNNIHALVTLNPQEQDYDENIVLIDIANKSQEQISIQKININLLPQTQVSIYRDSDGSRYIDQSDELLGQTNINSTESRSGINEITIAFASNIDSGTDQRFFLATDEPIILESLKLEYIGSISKNLKEIMLIRFINDNPSRNNNAVPL